MWGSFPFSSVGGRGCFAFTKIQSVHVGEDKLQIIAGFVRFEHNGYFGRGSAIYIVCIICIGWSRNLDFSSI